MATCDRIFFAKTRTLPRSADFAAFEQILGEGLQIYQVELSRDQLTSNHYHLVIRPFIDGEMSRFMGSIGGPVDEHRNGVPLALPVPWGVVWIFGDERHSPELAVC